MVWSQPTVQSSLPKIRGRRFRCLAAAIVPAGEFLARDRQPILNQAGKCVLTGELDLRVFLGHSDRAVASDLRRLDT